MSVINVREYVKRKLDFESKIAIPDIERAEEDFHLVMGILKSSDMDRNAIMRFTKMRADEMNNKVAGLGHLDRSRQRYLIILSLQTAEYVTAHKNRAKQNLPVNNNLWLMAKTR